jgi:hypothetical protein
MYRKHGIFAKITAFSSCFLPFFDELHDQVSSHKLFFKNMIPDESQREPSKFRIIGLFSQ